MTPGASATPDAARSAATWECSTSTSSLTRCLTTGATVPGAQTMPLAASRADTSGRSVGTALLSKQAREARPRAEEPGLDGGLGDPDDLADLRQRHREDV